MRTTSSQSGLTLVELAFAIVIFAFIVTSAAYGVRVVKQSKVKAFIVQVTMTKNAATMFRQRYGTWPGDFAQATTRLRNCNPGNRCENGNGDGVIASSTTANACQLPVYTASEQAFPCTTVYGAGNETAQFWRHLVLADMIDGLKLAGATYKWGDGLTKVRMGGGLQVLYNGDPANRYLADYGSGSLTGHFFAYQRMPETLHSDFSKTGDGPIAPWDTRAIDAELDDGAPLTGKFRSTGSWGCGNIEQAAAEHDYQNTEQMQCFFLYKFDS